MNFRAFDICVLRDNFVVPYKIKERKKFFSTINKLPKIEEGNNYYAPLYMHNNGDYIFGTLAQSYYTVLTTFEGSGKNEKELDENIINDKVIFYIDLVYSVIYIQGKRYPSPTLNKGQTIDRMTKILSDCLEESIALRPAKINYTVNEMIELFHRSYVKRIAFHNIKGIELPKGSVLHNPRADLDDAVAESWNVYSKDTVDYLELRAKDNEELSKNPIAKIGIKLANVGNPEGKDVIKEMDLFDSGQKMTIKPSGNDTKVISIAKSIQDDSYQIYRKIVKYDGEEYLE